MSGSHLTKSKIMIYMYYNWERINNITDCLTARSFAIVLISNRVVRTQITFYNYRPGLTTMRSALEVDLCHVRGLSHLASWHTLGFSVLQSVFCATSTWQCLKYRKNSPGSFSVDSSRDLRIRVTIHIFDVRHRRRKAGLWNLSFAVGHLARSNCEITSNSLSSVLYLPYISRH